MDALGHLRQEHAIILDQIRSIEDLASRAYQDGISSPPEQPGHLRISLLEGSKDAWQTVFTHIRKEEEALYPKLEEVLGKESGPVHVMRCEHGEILSGLMSILTMIVKSTGSSPAESEQKNLLKGIKELQDRLRDHMAREDRVIFWLAELNLSASHRRQLGSQMIEISKTQKWES